MASLPHVVRSPGVLLALAVAAIAGAAWALAARGRGDEGKGGDALRRILVTGFGPFGPHEKNPAWECLAGLDGTTIGGALVRTARIDVAYGRAEAQLDEAIRETEPDVVLSLGVAPGSELRVETLARNRDTAEAPDVAGVVRAGVAIREGGADTIPTRLPVGRILAALRADGLEVRTSDDAGGYLCNHLFYELMSRVPAGTVAGFVHVPVLEGPWDLARLARAVRSILEVLAAA